MLRRVTIGIVLGFVVGGCSLKTVAPGKPAGIATRPAGGEVSLDLQTRDDLRLLNQLLMRHEALSARVVIERLIGRIPDGDKTFAESMAELDRQLTEQDVEVAKGYLWAHNPPTDNIPWQTALAQANRRNQYNYPRDSGKAVLRILLEDPDREEHIGVMGRNLSYYSTYGDGYGRQDNLRSGDYIILGNTHERGPDDGRIDIELLRHACPILRIDVAKDDVVCAGELLLRAIPKQQLGRIIVHVVPEAGLSLDGAVVRVARWFAYWGRGHPLRPDRTCAIDDIAAGRCDIYVEVPKLACSLHHKIDVAAGQNTEVELHAYARRRVVIDWKYCPPSGEGEWRAGSSEVLTGRPASSREWGENGSVYKLTEWDGTSAGISGMNSYLGPAEPADFDVPQVRASMKELRSGGRETYPTAVGKVFAIRYGQSSRGGEGEAVIRIRSIEPVVPLATQAATTKSQ